MKILIVEDDLKLSNLMKRWLSQAGHVVDVEHDGPGGERMMGVVSYDVLVLDIMLPKKDGLAVLRTLRAKGEPIPVIVVTARDDVDDVVAGLRAGADDYLRKPFALDELHARIQTLARRAVVPPHLVLRVGDLALDTATKRVTRDNREVLLTGRELEYLEYFMRNRGVVVTRTMLGSALWNRDADILSNVIDVYVRRLRAKIEVEGMPVLLKTVRGIGYRMG